EFLGSFRQCGRYVPGTSLASSERHVHGGNHAERSLIGLALATRTGRPWRPVLCIPGLATRSSQATRATMDKSPSASHVRNSHSLHKLAVMLRSASQMSLRALIGSSGLLIGPWTNGSISSL